MHDSFHRAYEQKVSSLMNQRLTNLNKSQHLELKTQIFSFLALKGNVGIAHNSSLEEIGSVPL